MDPPGGRRIACEWLGRCPAPAVSPGTCVGGKLSGRPAATYDPEPSEPPLIGSAGSRQPARPLIRMGNGIDRLYFPCLKSFTNSGNSLMSCPGRTRDSLAA